MFDVNADKNHPEKIFPLFPQPAKAGLPPGAEATLPAANQAIGRFCFSCERFSKSDGPQGLASGGLVVGFVLPQGSRFTASSLGVGLIRMFYY